MVASRFDGSGPVARYWLSRCEGFAVQGGTHGTVVGLLHDHDPHATSRLVVRTRVRRRRIVPVGAVLAVDPAERSIVVARRRRRARRPRLRLALPTLPRIELGVAPALAAGYRRARPQAQRAAGVLRVSFRRLAAEARASAALLVRSASWRPFVRSARSASTRLRRARWPSSWRLRTTSSPLRSVRRIWRGARTTSST